MSTDNFSLIIAIALCICYKSTSQSKQTIVRKSARVDGGIVAGLAAHHVAQQLEHFLWPGRTIASEATSSSRMMVVSETRREEVREYT